MKTVMRIAAALCAAVLMTAMLAGCSHNLGEEEETYTTDGFSITMNNGFQEKAMQSVTYYLESSQVLFTAMREKIDSLSDTGLTADSTVRDYMDVVVEANGLADANIQQGTDGDFLYLTYEDDSSGKAFFFTVVAVKGSDSFWLCNFACPTGNTEKYAPRFLEWAATIHVD